MKSVIAQGATIAKAIEEALKKADMPKEFFVRVLEVGQASFLGFGGKKAKIALFFKQYQLGDKHDKMGYDSLFDNPKIKQQIDAYLQEIGLTPSVKKQPTQQQQQPLQKQDRPAHQQQRYQQHVQQKNKPTEQPKPQQQRTEAAPVAKIPEFTMRPLNQHPADATQGSDADQQKPKRRRRRYYGRRNNNSGSSGNGDSGSSL